MRTPRSRLPKDFSLEEHLAGCAQAVEFYPEACRGHVARVVACGIRIGRGRRRRMDGRQAWRSG